MTKLGKYEINYNHPLKNTNGIISDIVILTSSFIYNVLCEFLNLLRSKMSHHGDYSSCHILKKPYFNTNGHFKSEGNGYNDGSLGISLEHKCSEGLKSHRL